MPASARRGRRIAQCCVPGLGHPCSESNRQCCGEASNGCNAAEKSTDAAAGARGIRGGADRGHAAGKPRAVVCKSRRGRGFRCASGKTATGGRAVAGVAAEPRSKSQRQRREGRFQKLRPLSGVIACVGICSAVVSGRRARSQGGADRASPNAAVARRSPPESTSAPAAAAAAAQQPQRPAQVSPDISAAGPAPEPQAASPSLAPSLISEIDVEEVFLPQARLPVADDFSESNGTGRIFSAAPMPPNADAGTRAATTGAILNLLQEALQAIPQKAGNAAKPVLDEDVPLDPLPSANATAARAAQR